MSQHTKANAPSTPARGRPRSVDLDAEIRDATWDLIAELGCGGLTIEAIARRVGCSRSTLYRRFDTKAELISHVLDQTALDFLPEIAPDTSPRDRILIQARICAQMYEGNRGTALLHIVAASRNDATIARAVSAHSAMVEPYYVAPLAELAPDAAERTISLTVHGLIGAILHHVATRRDVLSPDEITRFVDAAIWTARS